MILDAHIHIWNEEFDKKKFHEQMKQAGVDGGSIFSIPPKDYMPTQFTPAQKLEMLLDVTTGHEFLFPFYFIDPSEEDALEQVDLAIAHGVVGFKIICYRFYPSDPRAIKVYEKITAAGRPILFHSGILYNKAISGEFNRPVQWEPLQDIKDIRFAMAHVSWPWTDECISLYGKFSSMRRKWMKEGLDNKLELFIDLTPGTPPIYRRDVLTKLCNMYEEYLPDHILFGTDCSVNNYKVDYVKEMIARDNAIYDENNMSEEFRDKIYRQNVLRFIYKA